MGWPRERERPTTPHQLSVYPPDLDWTEISALTPGSPGRCDMRQWHIRGVTVRWERLDT